jgi:hypothetical protein
VLAEPVDVRCDAIQRPMVEDDAVRFLRRVSESILPDKSLVVFVCTAAEAAAVDVAHGPFSPRVGPRGGRVRPLASVHDQMYWDTFEHLSALYSVVTGRPRLEALVDLRTEPQGELARLSDAFVAAFSPIGPPQRDGQDLWAEYLRIAEPWFKAAKWRTDMQIGGLTMRIFHVAWACRKATDRGCQAWAWCGKRVPEYVIASGIGEESYRQYRSSKRRRGGGT